jgi:hypothetical protein
MDNLMQVLCNTKNLGDPVLAVTFTFSMLIMAAIIFGFFTFTHLFNMLATVA